MPEAGAGSAEGQNRFRVVRGAAMDDARVGPVDVAAVIQSRADVHVSRHAESAMEGVTLMPSWSVLLREDGEQWSGGLLSTRTSAMAKARVPWLYRALEPNMPQPCSRFDGPPYYPVRVTLLMRSSSITSARPLRQSERGIQCATPLMEGSIRADGASVARIGLGGEDGPLGDRAGSHEQESPSTRIIRRPSNLEARLGHVAQSSITKARVPLPMALVPGERRPPLHCSPVFPANKRSSVGISGPRPPWRIRPCRLTCTVWP